MSFIPRILRRNAVPRKRGAAAEELAASHLRGQGLKILDRNYRIRGGEIDLIARDGDTLVFIEVRLRSRQDFGGAAESITPAKCRRIILAAQHYLAANIRGHHPPCRFDCVLLDALSKGSMQWIRNAFDVD
ncbi:MAG: YraN family protein [Proteobacteria bacterium]|nr:YraN family protein [Pseudomonadota bacterium]HQR04383.1 YraN family protein [Rhodocyclaceae bacterium]